MSMKRARRVNSPVKGSQAEGGLSFLSRAEPEKTWAEWMEGRNDAEFRAYAMTATFAKHELVNHGKFGKGVVTQVDGPRVEVLFEDGVRKLGHAAT